MKHNERGYILSTSHFGQLRVGGEGRVLIVKHNERGYILSTSHFGQLRVGGEGRVLIVKHNEGDIYCPHHTLVSCGLVVRGGY